MPDEINTQNLSSAETGGTKAQKKKKRRGVTILICVLAVLVLIFLVYFFAMNAKLDGLVAEHNFISARQTVNAMPWVKLINPTLLTYIEANCKIQLGDVEEGLQLLKPLGGFLDSDEIYKSTATIDMIKAYAQSDNPDELCAALENLPRYNADGQYNDLRDTLYEKCYNTALDIMTAEPATAQKLLTALPSDYLETSVNLQLSDILVQFNSTNNSAAYMQTFEALRPYAETDAAAKLYLSDSFISLFLNGSWQTDDGGYNFIQTTNTSTGNGTHTTTLPVGEKNIQAKYEDSAMYVLKQGATDFELMFSFTYIDYDTIQIFDAYNNVTYTMHRQ